jgi:hypothetical protein
MLELIIIGPGPPFPLRLGYLAEVPLDPGRFTARWWKLSMLTILGLSLPPRRPSLMPIIC